LGADSGMDEESALIVSRWRDWIGRSSGQDQDLGLERYSAYLMSTLVLAQIA
jgi:hypothetical protein